MRCVVCTCAMHVPRMYLDVCVLRRAHLPRMCTVQGHSHHKNLSDATLWLDHFQHPGGTVLGVDVVEDYALDLQHR